MLVLLAALGVFPTPLRAQEDVLDTYELDLVGPGAGQPLDLGVLLTEHHRLWLVYDLAAARDPLLQVTWTTAPR